LTTKNDKAGILRETHGNTIYIFGDNVNRISDLIRVATRIQPGLGGEKLWVTLVGLPLYGVDQSEMTVPGGLDDDDKVMTTVFGLVLPELVQFPAREMF